MLKWVWAMRVNSTGDMRPFINATGLGLPTRPISIILDRPQTLTPSHAWIGLQLKPKYSSSPQLTPLNATSSSEGAFAIGGKIERGVVEAVRRQPEGATVKVADASDGG